MKGGGGEERGGAFDEISNCQLLYFSSLPLRLCLSLYEANEHSTYRYMPICSSKHTLVLSHAVMCSETYPCCYGCQQYLKKDRGSSLSPPLPLMLSLSASLLRSEGVVSEWRVCLSARLLFSGHSNGGRWPSGGQNRNCRI